MMIAIGLLTMVAVLTSWFSRLQTKRAESLELALYQYNPGAKGNFQFDYSTR
jgi:hypothetical protein